MLEKLASFGAGFRTYIIVFVVILCVVAEKLFGVDIPGFDPGQDWLGFILGALGLGALRAGVKNDVVSTTTNSDPPK